MWTNAYCPEYYKAIIDDYADGLEDEVRVTKLMASTIKYVHEFVRYRQVLPILTKHVLAESMNQYEKVILHIKLPITQDRIPTSKTVFASAHCPS
jgi:hypothetical protein